jgi:hypothetical protein
LYHARARELLGSRSKPSRLQALYGRGMPGLERLDAGADASWVKFAFASGGEELSSRVKWVGHSRTGRWEAVTSNTRPSASPPGSSSHRAREKLADWPSPGRTQSATPQRWHGGRFTQTVTLDVRGSRRGHRRHDKALDQLGLSTQSGGGRVRMAPHSVVLSHMWSHAPGVGSRLTV